MTCAVTFNTSRMACDNVLSEFLYILQLRVSGIILQTCIWEARYTYAIYPRDIPTRYTEKCLVIVMQVELNVAHCDEQFWKSTSSYNELTFDTLQYRVSFALKYMQLTSRLCNKLHYSHAPQSLAIFDTSPILHTASVVSFRRFLRLLPLHRT